MAYAAFPIIIGIMFCMVSSSAFTVPPQNGYINDYDNILSDSTESKLEILLKKHELNTTEQVAVLTISSLNGEESIEEYAEKVFNTWQLGQKDKDNGVLLVVVTKDQQLRIEVGYGLEEKMTDMTAGRIIREQITPYFKNNNFEKGITAGIYTIISVLDHSKDSLNAVFETEQEQNSTSAQENDFFSTPFTHFRNIIIVIVAILLILLMFCMLLIVLALTMLGAILNIEDKNELYVIFFVYSSILAVVGWLVLHSMIPTIIFGILHVLIFSARLVLFKSGWYASMKSVHPEKRKIFGLTLSKIAGIKGGGSSGNSRSGKSGRSTRRSGGRSGGGGASGRW